MAKYMLAAIGELASELMNGPARLRKGHVDAAEQLIELTDRDTEYPYEFVVFRITGYRPNRQSSASHDPIPGKSLARDLQQLILDLCQSFSLQTRDYDEQIYDTRALAQKFQVSTKTIQRWRKRGLVARRLVFPDGKKRIAFLESSVERFARKNRSQIRRSRRFSKVSDSQRDEILRRARRMAGFTHCSLTEVARRIAGKSGRAIETVRYTIRHHDRQNPDDPIFPDMTGPLSDEEKTTIYRCFLNGIPAGRLARQYSRTRGSVYRIVNEMRARHLEDLEIDYIYNPEFDLPDADDRILEPDSRRGKASPTPAKLIKPPKGLPPYLRALYKIPLLTPQQEHDLFRRYNYLKYKADRLRRSLDTSHIRASQLKEVESLLLQSNVLKNRIIRSNLRLVVSIAKKHLSGPQTLFELVSDGNLALMRAVEKFDYARGFRFSTYASWAIMRNYARSVPKERYQLDRFATGHEEVLDIAASLRTYDPNELNLPELRESIEVMLSHLSTRERTILIDHYGLATSGDNKTFDQLGRELGVSKERVRQIELQALKKLRRLSNLDHADLTA